MDPSSLFSSNNHNTTFERAVSEKPHTEHGEASGSWDPLGKGTVKEISRAPATGLATKDYVCFPMRRGAEVGCWTSQTSLTLTPQQPCWRDKARHRSQEAGVQSESTMEPGQLGIPWLPWTNGKLTSATARQQKGLVPHITPPVYLLGKNLFTVI